MKLIAERRKLGVYYITRIKKGEKKTYKNAVRMTFTEEPAGTELYISPTEDGFHLSHKETKGSVMREVHTIKNINASKYADQTYLNFRGICEEETNFDIYKKGKDYFLKRSAVAASRNRKLNYSVKIGGKQRIALNPYARISSKDMSEMMSGLLDPVLVIEEHYAPNLYIEVYYKERKDAMDIPYKQLSKNLLANKFDENESIRQINSLFGFTPSRFFINRIGEYAKRGYLICYRKGNSLIYEPDNMICAICGKPIQGSIEKYEDWEICKPCDGYVKIISKRAAANGNDLTAAKEELQSCYDMLKKITEEI